MTHDPNNPYQVPAADVVSGDGPMAFSITPRSVPLANGISWISVGWDLFRQAPGPMVLMLVVYLVINMIVGVIPLVHVVSPLLAILFMGGVFIAIHRLDRTGQMKIEDLFAAFSTHFMPLLLLGLIVLGGIVVVGLLMFVLGLGTVLGNAEAPSGASIGFMLFLVLLALVLFFGLYFTVQYAVLLVVLGDQPLASALGNAVSAFMKNMLPFLLYSILAGIITLIAMIPLGLGLLVSTPVLFAAMYASYKDIFAAE